MTTPQPPRRRRIAGESGKGPARPAAPSPAAPRPAAPVPPTVQKRPAAPPVVPTVPAVRRPEPKAPRERSNTTAPTGSGSSRILLGVAALVAVAGLVAAFLGVRSLDSGSGGDESVAEATSAAATAAEVVFTYRYDDLEGYAADAKALMTPSFAEQFDEISPALGSVAPQRQVVVQSSVRDAAPLPCSKDCSADEVTVLVFLDQARLVGDEPEPTVFGNRITVSMVERDGTWLVSDIRAL